MLPSSPAETLLHIGTYGGKGGAGLVPLLIRDDGSASIGEPDAHFQDASFAVDAPEAKLRYFVEERDEGAIVLARWSEGRWQRLARTASGGRAPCFLDLSPDRSWLAVANYGSGSIAVIPLDPATGEFLGTAKVQPNEGSGPDRERQEGPHAHCVAFDPRGRQLLQTDLGTDEVLAWEVSDRGLANRSLAFAAPPGSGPRLLVQHSDSRRVLLISELSAQLRLFARSSESFKLLHLVDTAPPDFAGENLGGDVALNAAGDRVYVTNRGHDSVAVFRLAGDRLELLQHISSGGASPRHFRLIEHRALLVLANEEGGNIVIFDIDEGGLLQSAGAPIDLPGAAFVGAPIG